MTSQVAARRKWRSGLLFIHVTVSVGWLGAVASFLVMSSQGQSATGAFMAVAYARTLEWLGWWVLVPMCAAALSSGVAVSVLSGWGLVQHYWVLAKLVSMIIATGLLLLHMGTVTRLLELIAQGQDVSNVFASLTFDAIAALILLVLLTALSIFKPPGRVFEKNT